MTIIVDAVFSFALALSFPNGDLQTAALTFPNQKECVAARAEKIVEGTDIAQKNVGKMTVYIGECVALPLTVLK